MVLPDTSVWVDYLRLGERGPAAELDDLLAGGRVLVCGPVAAELVAGVAEGRRAELWALLAGLPWADAERADWRAVGELAGALRRAGTSVPLTDVHIAVAAMSAGARLWSRDTDFARIAELAPDLALHPA